MSRLPDPFEQGMQQGWRVHDARTLSESTLTCDVAIVGTGAGGALTAELLAQAGLRVLMIEEGPLKTSRDFNQNEAEAYASLYQENASRQTLDRGISILQGRCVGGSTTVNWTTSFRTPDSTLQAWQREFGLTDYTSESMRPHFEAVERRLHIRPWEIPLNRNNQLLEDGLQQLGLEPHRIARNVKGCWNLGSCGMGCPTNAKQSMLVTTIPGALQAGGTLVHHLRAQHYELEGSRIRALRCQAVGDNGADHPTPPIRVLARHHVLAAGGINGPALLKRSEAPDPHGHLGRRTFLHPVAFSAAVFDQPVQAWAGAPQTVYTDAFMPPPGVAEQEMGFKIEAIPLHPGLTSILLGGVGATLKERMDQHPHTQMLHALMRDGFHPDAAGGRVMLNPDGSPLLHYPLNDYVLQGIRRAFLAMARIQFASGARSVLPYHDQARPYASLKAAEAGIASLDMRAQVTGVGSAHVMGGCTMAAHPELGVVDPRGRHWQLHNLSVHDGSVFPTSIGANPQQSIYGMAHRLTLGLLKEIGPAA